MPLRQALVLLQKDSTKKLSGIVKKEIINVKGQKHIYSRLMDEI
jgi:hypothetical protein